jgi:hypothetical protein
MSRTSPFTAALSLAGLLASLLTTPQAALAVVVAPGDTVALPGTTAAAEPGLAGDVLEDETFDFSLLAAPGSQDLITGTVQQRVVRETASNTLDFYWRITQLAGGTLGYLRIGHFVSAVYDVNYRLDGVGDVGPASVTRFTAGEGGVSDDNFANFNFIDGTGANTLAPGQSSYFIFLHTDATAYAKTGLIDVASTGTFTDSALFDTFAPAVPEPGRWALFLAGLAMTAKLAKTARTTRQRNA